MAVLPVVRTVIVVAVIVVAVFALIYYIIYTMRINRIVREGMTSERKMPDISKVVMGGLILVLVLVCGVLIYDAGREKPPMSRNNYAIIDVSDPDGYEYIAWAGGAELADASYAEMYSEESNPGYDKEIRTDGDFKFTVFKSTEPADSFHPDFLCFVEYMGESTEGLCMSNGGSFISNTDDSYSGSYAAGEPFDKILYIGCIDADCSFVVSVSVFDEAAEKAYDEAMQKAMEEDSGEFPKESDFAISSAQVKITN